MKPERWKKIETLCQEAMAFEGEERTTYLQHSCADDPDLLEEVKSLLEFENSDILNEPLVQVESSFIFDEKHSEKELIIGPYRIIRTIASGGMGQVYLAVRDDAEFERFVALKVIRKELVSDDVLSHFYEERQILASLNHPNIARLFDGGTTKDGLPWFAMEYVEGTAITEFCDQRKCTTDEKLELFLNVCSAVQYAHQNLVTHRDLKPANILITETGEPKLLDFGIAKLTDFENESGGRQYRSQLMTPEYASPEQVSHESISTVSDLYSLGVVLYELLTGRLPYRFENRDAEYIKDTVCNKIPEKPSVIDGGKNLKGDLDFILLKALKKQPSERYTSVEQLSDDIQRYQRKLPVLAQKDTFAYRSKKFLQRHTWSSVASAAIAVLVISFATVTYLQSQVIEERAIEAENERDRAEEVSNFLIDLFESVDPSEAQDESLSAVELLHRGAERVDTELQERPELQAELYIVISDVYESLGLYNEGVKMADYSLRLLNNLYDDIHPDIARGLNSLGWLYHQQGDFERADSLLQTALTMRQNLFGEEENLDVARSLNDLAVVKQARGDFKATDSLLNRALEIRRSLLGNQHESVGVALSNYAALKWGMNELTSATEMMEESLQILKENLGREHLQVAIAMTNLAALYLTQSEIEKAENLYREALDIRYQLVGEQHPDVAYSLVHLGNLLRMKGEYKEAEELLLKALEMRINLLGEQHILVGDTYRLIGVLYRTKGDESSAVNYFKAAIDLLQTKFPDGHVETAQVQQLLGETYMSMNEFKNAGENFEEAYNIFKRFYGEEDSRTVESMIYLGASLYDSGKAKESESLLTDGLKLIQQTGMDSRELREIAGARLLDR